jgi:hypothetical protein
LNDPASHGSRRRLHEAKPIAATTVKVTFVDFFIAIL